VRRDVDRLRAHDLDCACFTGAPGASTGSITLGLRHTKDCGGRGVAEVSRGER
jgi:hypothetical protein